MLLPTDFHLIKKSHDERIASWVTSDKPDKDGVALTTCEVYQKGNVIRFTFTEWMPTSARAFAPEYTFTDPVHPTYHLPANPPPSKENVGIHKELTPEEKAHEVN